MTDNQTEHDKSTTEQERSAAWAALFERSKKVSEDFQEHLKKDDGFSVADSMVSRQSLP